MKIHFYIQPYGDIAFDLGENVVEVVRCAECEHYEDHKLKVFEVCTRDKRYNPMKPDDFCSYGERRSGE